MKQLSTLAAILLGIVLLIQTAGSADPRGTQTVLRTVPVNIMAVMQPSRMVAVNYSIQENFEREQVPISLDPGQVFILTAWSLNSTDYVGPWTLSEGPTGASQKKRDMLRIRTSEANPQTSEIPQHVFCTGIRFPRDAGGMADIYVIGGPAGTGVFVQGYITDDF